MADLYVNNIAEATTDTGVTIDSNVTLNKSANTGVTPHIVINTLYPGYNDKQLDGSTALAASTTGPNSSTVTSSKYGTVQSDGRM